MLFCSENNFHWVFVVVVVVGKLAGLVLCLVRWLEFLGAEKIFIVLRNCY